MKIVIIGGHITPALATMVELKKLDPAVQFYFIGRKHTREGDTAFSAEYLLMKSKGIPSYALVTGRLQRYFTKYTIPSLLKIPYGFFQSIKILREIKPDVICSFGGYVAVPVVIAGWFLRIPSVTHEQTLVPGLANKILSRFVKKVALSFEETRKFYPNCDVIVTGNPLRIDELKPQGNFKLDKSNLPVVYVTGGNQGAHAINELIFELLPDLLKIAHVVHQTGNSSLFKDYDKARKLELQVKERYSGKYFAFDYISPDSIGDVFSLSDVVVGRSGVNTICELLYLGKKAIMIPIPFHKEQEYNADFFSRMGLGVALSQDRLSASRLLSIIKEFIDKKISEDDLLSAKSSIYPDAAVVLAKVIHDIV